jgi:hypothetical protein
VADVVDLDVAVGEVERRAAAWWQSGITVGSVTWHETSEGWPQPFKTDRSQVNSADSIGISLRKGEQEGAVVLFEGGWCDFIDWDGDADEVLQDAPEATTVKQYRKVLDRLTALFT